MKKSKRQRVSREDVRQNAKAQGGGQDWLNLPPGTRMWAPEKAGRFLLNIIPYVVSCSNHPDKVEKEVIWYKRPFSVHHGVGIANESITCPGTIGMPCPICQEKGKLAKNYEENEDQVKVLNPKRWVAYNIVDPDDEDAVAVFAMSRGKFAMALEKELEEGDEGILSFYDVTSEGKTLKVRFSDEVFAGRKYLKASRIDFIDREAMDEEEILGKAVDLDKMFNVLPYDKIKSLFLQLGVEEETEEKEEEEEKPTKKDDDSEEEKPKKKESKKSKEEGPECPEGGKFGEDVDKFDDKCDDCALWSDCEKASSE